MPSSSENIGTKLEEIVTALGRYYGATSRSDFVSMLLLRERDLPRNAFEIPDTTPARIAAQALLDVTEGGFTTPELIRRLNEYVGSARASNDIPGLIKICYEPELLADSDNRANSVLRVSSRPSVRKPGGQFIEQVS